MRNSVIATLIACSFVSMNVQAEDLLQTYQQALINDAQYASARAALRAGQEKLPQARYDTIVNGLRLKSAAGTLQEQDLQLVNALLTP